MHDSEVTSFPEMSTRLMIAGDPSVMSQRRLTRGTESDSERQPLDDRVHLREDVAVIAVRRRHAPVGVVPRRLIEDILRRVRRADDSLRRPA